MVDEGVVGASLLFFDTVPFRFPPLDLYLDLVAVAAACYPASMRFWCLFMNAHLLRIWGHYIINFYRRIQLKTSLAWEVLTAMEDSWRVYPQWHPPCKPTLQPQR